MFVLKYSLRFFLIVSWFLLYVPNSGNHKYNFAKIEDDIHSKFIPKHQSIVSTNVNLYN